MMLEIWPLQRSKRKFNSNGSLKFLTKWRKKEGNLKNCRKRSRKRLSKSIRTFRSSWRNESNKSRPKPHLGANKQWSWCKMAGTHPQTTIVPQRSSKSAKRFSAEPPSETGKGAVYSSRGWTDLRCSPPQLWIKGNRCFSKMGIWWSRRRIWRWTCWRHRTRMNGITSWMISRSIMWWIRMSYIMSMRVSMSFESYFNLFSTFTPL